MSEKINARFVLPVVSEEALVQKVHFYFHTDQLV